MSPREVELALKKQRLQIQSAMLRTRLARQTRGLAPAFEAVDMVRSGYAWVRQRPYIPLALVVGIGIVRPRFIWRWLRRGWLGWQVVRRVRGVTGRAAPAYAAWRSLRKDG